MRRRHWLSGAIVGLLVCTTPAVALAWSSGAHATASKRFVGKTTQGTPIRFFIKHTDKGAFVWIIDAEVQSTCPGSDAQGTTGLGGGKTRLQDDGTFRVHLYNYWFGHFDFAGQITGSTATGTISTDGAAVTRDSGTQLCLSGPISWTASKDGAAVASLQTKTRVLITQSESGKVTWAMESSN